MEQLNISNLKEISAEIVQNALSRVYERSEMKTLLIRDKKYKQWPVRDKFPNVGNASCIIYEIRNYQWLNELFVKIQSIDKDLKEKKFYFINEEKIGDSFQIQVEFNGTVLRQVSTLYAKCPGLDSVLIESEFNWIFKLHHEGFGFFNGKRSLVEELLSIIPSDKIEKPLWQN